MNYKCPNCGFIMKPIFCDCQTYSTYDVYRERDGLWYHKCGRPFRPKTQEFLDNPENFEKDV